MDKPKDKVWQQAKANMIKNILQSGLSLQQLANKAEISITALRNFVNGKTRIISTLTMIKISNALNMKVDDFIGRKYL